MDVLLPFLGIVALIGLFIKVMSKRERDEHWTEHEDRLRQTEAMFSLVSSADEESKRLNNEEMNNNDNEPNTLGLMLNILDKLGCQPKANEDGTLYVQYQGEDFLMEFGGMYACVGSAFSTKSIAQTRNKECS